MSKHANLYKLVAWTKILRPVQLMNEPLCAFCAAKGIDTVATVVDHIKPHRGDRLLFLDPKNLQSLCKPCHDSDKQSEEVNGYSSSIGEDGWPIDDAHPFISGAKP